jgi:hypothetical protein
MWKKSVSENRVGCFSKAASVYLWSICHLPFAMSMYNAQCTMHSATQNQKPLQSVPACAREREIEREKVCVCVPWGPSHTHRFALPLCTCAVHIHILCPHPQSGSDFGFMRHRPCRRVSTLRIQEWNTRFVVFSAARCRTDSNVKYKVIFI